MKIQNRDYVNEEASSILQKKILCIKKVEKPANKTLFLIEVVQPRVYSHPFPAEATLWYAAVHSGWRVAN